MTLSIYKVKPFSRWAEKETISDVELRQKAETLISDRVADVLVWKCIYKHPVVKLSNGRRAGFRVVASADNIRVFFLFGFSLDDRPGLNEEIAIGQQKLSYEWLAFTDDDLIEMVGIGLATEVIGDEPQ